MGLYCVSRAIKCDFQPYIQRYNSQMNIPHSNAHQCFFKVTNISFAQIRAMQAPQCGFWFSYDIINDLILFTTVHCRIYCWKFLILSNQTSCYIIMYISIVTLHTCDKYQNDIYCPQYLRRALKFCIYQSPLILNELFQHNLINVSYLTACYLYQVMMTLHFLNDVANDAESTQKSKITS